MQQPLATRPQSIPIANFKERRVDSIYNDVVCLRQHFATPTAHTVLMGDGVGGRGVVVNLCCLFSLAHCSVHFIKCPAGPIMHARFPGFQCANNEIRWLITESWLIK